MRNVLYAAGAVFIFLGVVSLLAVFLIPLAPTYGFSVPAAFMLVLGGVLLLALASQIDSLHKLETAIYGLQKSLRQSVRPTAGNTAPSAAAAAHPATATPTPGQNEPDTSSARTTAAGTEAVSKIGATTPRRERDKKREEMGEKAAAVLVNAPQSTVPAQETARSTTSPLFEAPSPDGKDKTSPPPPPPAPMKQKEQTATPPPATEKAQKPPLATVRSDDEERTPSQEVQPSAPADPTGGHSADSEETAFLYIVREETVRGRKARVLSDGTIEAELDEGWLRFENMEHLNEYLDALEELRKKGML